VSLGGLVAYFGRGLAFLLQRRLTAAARREQAASLNSVATFSESEGERCDHGGRARLEVVLRNPTFGSGPVATQAAVNMAHDADEPVAYQRNFARKTRVGAAYEVAEAQLMRALMDLKLLISDKVARALYAAQRKWAEYRRLLEFSAALEFEGGTHAPLAASLTGLSETERRNAEIRAQVKDRSAR
jgi:uncharacterized protein YecT (DUF1311 family)